MKKLLLALAIALAPASAWAQCSGVFPNNTFCGNDTGAPTVPHAITGLPGSGTVSSFSFTNANGFTGSVATSLTTPNLTLGTDVTGILKGNGTAISAATSGTDYAPATTGTSLLLGNGSGGFTAFGSIPSGKPLVGDGTGTPVATTLTVSGGGTGNTTFTTNLPLIGNSTGAIAQGTLSGNTTIFGTTNGTLTNGHCVSIDSSGNFVDAGGACTTGGGGGTVTAGTANQIAYYPASAASVSGTSTIPSAVQANITAVSSSAALTFKSLTLTGAASNPFITATGSVVGPVAVFNNGVNPPVTLKFTQNGHTDAAWFGAQGGLEANVSYNMDYSTGVHLYGSDSTKNAVWLAVNRCGFTIQYAPKGYGGGGDIWTNQGSQKLLSIDNACDTSAFNFKIPGQIWFGAGSTLSLNKNFLDVGFARFTEATGVNTVDITASTTTASIVTNAYSGSGTSLQINAGLTNQIKLWRNTGTGGEFGQVSFARSITVGDSTDYGAGAINATGFVRAPYAKYTGLAYASLPTPAVGMVAYISDGLAANCGDTTCTTWGTTVAGGGGALKLFVWYNGTNWTLAGK